MRLKYSYLAAKQRRVGLHELKDYDNFDDSDYDQCYRETGSEADFNEEQSRPDAESPSTKDEDGDTPMEEYDDS